MTPSFERLQQTLKKLPGLGWRSAERVALHLLVERASALPELIAALEEAASKVRPCRECGHLAEGDLCPICSNPRRDPAVLCVVERVPDLLAVEKSGAYSGRYHVLQGKLSPLKGVGPEHLALGKLASRLDTGGVTELILALGNDIEGEATCHYIQDRIAAPRAIRVTRIGFGLPSGGDLVYADATTLRSALEGRRSYS